MLKFGGTSLATPKRVRRAAVRVRALARCGYAPVVVVSATGHTTDRLLARFDGVCTGDAARERDRALATGETLAAALLAAALLSIGVRALSFTAAEAGIEAEGEFGHGVPSALAGDRVRRALHDGIVPVLTGFQGIRADGELVTLGRGGSDTSAVFLAAQLRAPCHIVTDVDGVYDRDPRQDVSAIRFESLSHARLNEISATGAQVVHPEAARIAAEHCVPLHIYHFTASVLAPRGTRVDARPL